MRALFFVAVLMTACANDAAPVVDLGGSSDVIEEVREKAPPKPPEEAAIAQPCTERCALTCPMGQVLTGCSSFYEEIWCECTEMLRIPGGPPQPGPFPEPTPTPPFPPPPPF